MILSLATPITPMKAAGALAVSIALTLGSAALQAEEALPDTETWPVSVEAVVIDILSKLPEDEKRAIRDTPRDDLEMFHLGWGKAIRNQYGLSHGNDALCESACGEPCHADDASMIIIEKVWEALQHDATQAH